LTAALPSFKGSFLGGVPRLSAYRSLRRPDSHPVTRQTANELAVHEAWCSHELPMEGAESSHAPRRGAGEGVIGTSRVKTSSGRWAPTGSRRDMIRRSRRQIGHSALPPSIAVVAVTLLLLLPSAIAYNVIVTKHAPYVGAYFRVFASHSASGACPNVTTGSPTAQR
jgi:hypothetical protein